MGVAKISFCVGHESVQASSRLLAPVLASWPSLEVPEVRSLDLDALLAGGPKDWLRSEGSLAALLFVLTGRENPAHLAAMFDEIHGAMMPAVVVSPRDDDVRPLLQRHGILVVSDRTPAQVIAAMLYALSERQSLVGLLRREVGTGKRADRGMRGEMDRLHEELHLAATVQRELLPQRLPEDEAIEFASLYHPATYVSGDLFDARAIDEHRIVFFIADAVGHGVPAALITMMLSRALLNQFSLGAGSGGEISPAACLSGLNRELCQHASGNYRFATAVCGILDKRDFCIRLAGAGHPPTLLLRAGETKSYESQGPLLGVFAEAEYTDEVFTLEPGATLLLYTDGFELAFPAPGTDAADRQVAPREYMKHMNIMDASESGCDVREGMDRLARLMAGQEGSLHQRDDVTALAIRRLEAVALREAA